MLLLSALTRGCTFEPWSCRNFLHFFETTNKSVIKKASTKSMAASENYITDALNTDSKP